MPGVRPRALRKPRAAITAAGAPAHASTVAHVAACLSRIVALRSSGSRVSGGRVLTGACRVALLVIVLGSNAGCLFVRASVRPTGATVAVPSVRSRRAVILKSPFGDARPDERRCGTKKSGFGWETADVVCAVPPGRWIADALTIGLVDAGYDVYADQTGAEPTSVTIQGQIFHFFIDPIEQADIGVQLTVSSPTGLRASAFYVQNRHIGFLEIEREFQVAVDGAIAKAVHAMVLAINQLLTRYPQLGLPPDAVSAEPRSALAVSPEGSPR